MRLIASGPDLPQEMLSAAEEGRLVLFCGAGISIPAGLPSFKSLVERVYETLRQEKDELESRAFEKGLYDRTLGLLERRLAQNASSVRHAITSILRPTTTGSLGTHEAILAIAHSADGSDRIVTTNFDLLFEKAAASRSSHLKYAAAPYLPIPKPQKWNGLVYLHGRIDDDDPDGTRLVYTSADFGTAYLTERSASRFVSELFRHFTVLFIGYSLEDPVMRYLMDALDSDRVRTGALRRAYALADEKDATTSADWRAKGVEPLLYAAGKHHLMHETLREWASLRSEGRHARKKTLGQMLPTSPASLSDEEKSRVQWALDDDVAVAAIVNPTTHVDWLRYLDKCDWTSRGAAVAGLLRDGATGNKPLQDALALWIADSLLDKQDCLEWALSLRRPHEVVRSRIRAALAKPNELVPPLRQAWSLVSDEDATRDGFDLLDAHMLCEQAAKERWEPALRRRIANGLTPFLVLRAQVGVLRGPGKSWPADAQVIEHIVSGDVELRAREQAWPLVHAIAGRTDADSALADMLDDATTLLKWALDLWAMTGKASAEGDLGTLHLPDIDSRSEHPRLHEWASLVELNHQAISAALRFRPALARATLDRWLLIPYATFRRLSLHTASHSNLWTEQQKLALLLEGTLQ